MIDQIDLSSFFETKLNENTQDLVFKVWTWANYIDSDFERVQNTKTKFIHVLLGEGKGKSIGIAGVDAWDEEFTTTFLFLDAQKGTLMKALKEVALNTNAKIFDIGTDKADVRFTTPTIIGSQLTTLETLSNGLIPIQRTELYSFLQMPLGVIPSNRLIHGNSAIITLDGNELLLENSVFELIKQFDSFPVFGNVENESIANQGKPTPNLTFYYESTPFHQALVQDAFAGTNSNKKYTLRIQFDGLDLTKTVILENITFDPPKFGFTRISCVMSKASDVI
jgi:hypothetical protein